MGFIVNLLVGNYYRLFYRCFKNSGINKSIKNPEYIISLTSYPGRINSVSVCIETIMRQTVLADRLILWLGQEQFPNANLLPKELIHLKKRGLEIRFCDDIRSHTKYYYAMQEFRESVIITLDDDVFYPKRTIERLIQNHKKNPKNIYCNMGLFFNKNLPYTQWRQIDKKHLFSSPKILPLGVGGVLYPKYSLSSKIFNKEDIKSLCIHTDDLWLKVMSMINRTDITFCGEFSQPLFTIAKSQKENLGVLKFFQKRYRT